eukprot:scaffold55089_cov57-Attheya_sp.AAC.3
MSLTLRKSLRAPQQQRLTGTLPEVLYSLTNLEVCALASNFLTGTLFSEWLELANNLLSGPLPSGMGELTSLETLMLGNNDFIGNIPESLGRLTQL